ncbi:hypothetical protein EDB59_1092 [Vibrio crassostreae]|uniref:ABC-three component system protein n=1 Tax=Vibrio crassostreae TaxID=246167 RepID=UPI000FC1A77A|nr:ABC-three component system protein [Vibrio crassostreae]ROR70438.1 hypothetical protein EDB59_1092 [Vibrio crassostreae]
MNNKRENHDATSSMLGYLYQIRYALYLALKKHLEVDDIDDCLVSIESLDDVAFEQGDNVHELIQTKHHISKLANLTNRSSDIWATVRIWSNDLSHNESFLSDSTIRLLVTTSTSTKESIANYLSTDVEKRNAYEALRIMEKIAKEGIDKSSNSNLLGYKAFMCLSPEKRFDLVNSISILCESPDISDIEKEIKKHCRAAVNEQHLSAYITRLEGVWFRWSIRALMEKGKNSIPLSDLSDEMDNLRNQFLPFNLPSDYDNYTPETDHQDDANSIYMKQLEILGATTDILKLAHRNYIRAKKQRSRWSKDGLLKPGELGNYDLILEGEWEHHKSLLAWSECNVEVKGRNLYLACQNEGAKPIRPGFSSPYVARGSYHILSNSLKIGWIENYKTILNQEDTEDVA